MQLPDDSFETAARARGFTRIAGVDEAGRGPLCGPVTAAAVVLHDPAALPPDVRDSKTLSHARRAALAETIKAVSDWHVAHASVEEIESLNIHHASHLAMCRAVAGLARPPDHVLVDGKFVPRGLCGEAVIKGDGRVISIAAASILAKVARDALMAQLAQDYPGYGWERNAGYPTRDHVGALLRLGLTPHHRRSFAPVHKILYADASISL